MAHPADTTAAPARFTEEHPQFAEIHHDKYEDVVLSKIAYWVDDEGNHIIQSTEFDVLAIGGTADEVTERFVADVFDLARALTELIRKDEATDTEKTLFARLIQPIIAVARLLLGLSSGTR